MTSFVSPRWLAGVALALGAVVASATANAATDVYFSIGLQVPGLYVQPAPVYVQPQPYYVPAPVYYRPVAPAYYSAPAPIYVPRHDYRRNWHRSDWQRRGPYGDLDRDGIANRHDRDRDGDGIRNRDDRQPNNPWRR